MRKTSLCALMAAGLIATGCGGPVQDQPPEVVGVAVSIDSAGIAVEHAFDLAGQDVFVRPGAHQLRFELRDDAGEVMVSGVAADPRHIHGEADIDGDGSLERVDTEVDAGILHLRLPQVPGTLVLFEVDGGSLREIGRTEFAPDAQLRARNARTVGTARSPLTVCDIIPGAPTCEATLLSGSGGADNVDILVLGDGFTEDELGSLRTRALELGERLTSLHDYRDYRDRFNIWYLPLPSADSGIDDPESGGDLATIFGLSFGDVPDGSDQPGRPRRCIFPNDSDSFALIEALRLTVGAEVVAMLANTTEHGGCATSRFFTSGLTDKFHRTVAHELGHSVYGLGDEYDYGACREPNRPNLGGALDDLPWADQVNAAVPTLSRDERLEMDSESVAAQISEAHEGTVGAYEGASYCAYDAYRPSFTCRMRERLAGEEERFCPVCRAEFENHMESLSADDTCPARWRNDGTCDPCLGTDPDCCVSKYELKIFGKVIYTHTSECDSGCGDGICQEQGSDEVAAENVASCPFDCSQARNVCGDGQCNGQENPENCGQDCGCSSVDDIDEVTPFGCFCSPDCIDNGDCCADACEAFGTCG